MRLSGCGRLFDIEERKPLGIAAGGRSTGSLDRFAPFIQQNAHISIRIRLFQANLAGRNVDGIRQTVKRTGLSTFGI